MSGKECGLDVIECYDLPEDARADAVYKLLPKNADGGYYRERTDRNIGWITRDEQEIIRRSVIGVAGCGGMGGALAQIFLRLGAGEIRIADCEVFDASNINRQFAAARSTIGKSKALETAKMLRRVSDDFTLVVYPRGISEETAKHFISGCGVICDEIEFWAVGSRILLHREARKVGVSLFCCDTIGFGTRLFFFTPQSATMEECLGLTYGEAATLQKKVQNGTATEAETRRVMESAWRGLLTEFPEYCPRGAFSTVKAVEERLMREGKGAILATNPSLAGGLIADRVLLYLLRNSGVAREIQEVPEMPGYFYVDVAKMEAKVVRGRWW